MDHVEGPWSRVWGKIERLSVSAIGADCSAGDKSERHAWSYQESNSNGNRVQVSGISLWFIPRL